MKIEHEATFIDIDKKEARKKTEESGSKIN